MASYTQGDWYGVVSPAGVALLPPDVPGEALERIWADLRAGKGLAAILDGLVGSFGTSLSGLPHFAALVPDGVAGVRVAMRGAVEARLWTADGETVVVSGDGVTTWSERAINSVTTAEVLLVGGMGGAELPVLDGIVRASSLKLVGLDGSTQPEPAKSAPEPARSLPDPVLPAPTASFREPVEEPGPTASLPGVVEEPEPIASFPDLAEEPEPTASLTESGEEPVSTASFPELVEEPVPTTSLTEPLGVTAPASSAETLIGTDEPNEYDRLLFGETVLSSVEAAAVRDEEADGATSSQWPAAPAASALGQGAQLPPPPPPLANPAQFSPPPPPPSGSMIAGVPGFGGTPATPAPVPLGDHDGETVSIDQLHAMLASRGGTPVPATTPAARIRHATLLIPGQAPLTLDRGAIVGTRPKFTRVQAGFAPHLVTVSSPSSEISRSHVEIRVEGTTLLAVDLNSTNGTMLLRRGVDPVRLQPGEPSILVPGDRVDLGDGIVLDFEGMA